MLAVGPAATVELHFRESPPSKPALCTAAAQTWWPAVAMWGKCAGSWGSRARGMRFGDAAIVRWDATLGVKPACSLCNASLLGL